MNSETLRLILRFQLENLEELRAKKENCRGGEVSDAQLGIDASQNEFVVQEQLVADIAMSRQHWSSYRVRRPPNQLACA